MSPERIPVFWSIAAAWLVALSLAVGPLLARIGLVRPNFRGDRIPAGYGVLVLLWSGPVLAALALGLPAIRREIAAYLAVVVGMGLLGFVDDVWGDRTRTGLKGHFRAFFVEGVVTTGFVKAAGGMAVAIAAPRVILALSWPDAILDGAVIALSANALNLLDLRPGRAGAAFLLLGALLILARWNTPEGMPLLFVFIPALVVYERDSRGRVMMGDAGSNLLGGALGISYVLAFPSSVARIILLGLLVALHVVAERISISRAIERSPVLRRIDRLTGIR